jgi:hypothetical protein
MFLYIKRSRLKTLLDGWVGGWVGGWVAGKAGLRIAYSNKKIMGICGRVDGWMDGCKSGVM